MTLVRRFLESGGVVGPGEADALERLAEASPYLGAFLLRWPEWLAQAVAELPRERTAAELAAELEGLVESGLPVGVALRRLRNRTYVRLGLRELGPYRLEEVARELAALADVCFQAAVAEADRALCERHGEPLEESGARARFSVVAMGKHGAEELNFCSDVDVLYVYSSDQGRCTGSGLTLHEYFVKLGERVTRTISEPTDEGFVFRVDLRLRPEGGAGALANSLGALESYYESWGRPWERLAWLKARPCAGDRALGAAILAEMRPFCYPRTPLFDVVAEIRALDAKIKAQLQRGAGDRDIKLGKGGIREIEFFVQALQLLHGGKDPALRERGTLRALDRLLFAGLVSAGEHRELSESYLFLRRLEHRIQLEDGQQTHALPERAERVEALGRLMGFGDGATFGRALTRLRARVHEVYATLGVPDDETSDLAALVALVPFRDREAADTELELLARKSRSPLSPDAPAQLFQLAPVLLRELGESPDPDLALRQLVDFAARGGLYGAWQLLAAHPPLLKLLVSLFGTSEFLSRIFIARPDLLDQLLLRGDLQRTPDSVGTEISSRLEAEDDVEGALELLRRIKAEHVLRIGLGDVAGALDQAEVCAQLSMLADALIDAALGVVARAQGLGAATGFTVLALGKLGSEELDYASDLDLLFVHDPSVDPERAARIGRRLLAALGAMMAEGRLYEVDMRLRPSGNQGLLVSSLPAFRDYHQGNAQLWERQVLLQARAVGGDRTLGAEVERIAEAAAYAEGQPETSAEILAHEIVAMRKRIQAELSSESRERYDMKLGRGGMLDVEFLVQYLQLRHGGRDRHLRVRGTLPALDSLRAGGYLEVEPHRLLHGGYEFLRRLKGRIRIVHDRADVALPRPDLPGGAEALATLARRMGYREADAGRRLEADFLRIREAVRAEVARQLPGLEEPA